MSMVTPPPHDGAIEEAFADLDARLASWSEAMGNAQQMLAGAACLQATQAAAAALPTDQPGHEISHPAGAADAAELLPAAVSATGRHEAGAGSQGPAATVSDVEAKYTERRSQSEPKPASEVEPPGPELDLQRQEREAAKHEQALEREEAAAAQREEDALLASLDEDTAKAIRVMRRLDPSKKSVRELLEEYQAGSGTPSGPIKNKSWWSRGRG